MRELRRKRWVIVKIIRIMISRLSTNKFLGPRCAQRENGNQRAGTDLQDAAVGFKTVKAQRNGGLNEEEAAVVLQC